MPEMVVPVGTGPANNDFHKAPMQTAISDPTIQIEFTNSERLKKHLDVSIDNWFNSVNHEFRKKSEDVWEFRSVMLPGQSYSLVFSKKEKPDSSSVQAQVTTPVALD
jgi:hypothetical protein